MTASGSTSLQSGRTEVRGGSCATGVVVLVQRRSGSAWNRSLQEPLEQKVRPRGLSGAFRGGPSGPQTSVLPSADRCLQCGRQRQLRASATSRWRFWLIAWPGFLIVEFSRKFHLQDQSHRRSSMCFYMWKEPNQNPASGNPWLPQVSHYLNAAVCIKSVPHGPQVCGGGGGKEHSLLGRML